jgi:hypothetical protein
LTLDPRFTCASNYVCFAPHHFLLTEHLLRPGFDWLAPPQRPMDELPLDADGPQEDEFALLGRGAPSPYAAIAFPHQGLDLLERLRQEERDPRSAKRWRREFSWWIRGLTYRVPKRLVLKSPAHTFRVSRLLKMYPDAQFVHLAREPLPMLASTLAMWRSLCETQSLMPLDPARLEDCIVDTWCSLCRRWRQTRATLAPGQFHEMQYERLLDDPWREMTALYAALHLGEFDITHPGVIRHLQSVKAHRPADHPISESLRRRVGQACQQF